MFNFNKVGLGLFPFSNVFSIISDSNADNIISAFIDNGGKYIECGPLYSINDRVRPILAKFNRESFFLSTKCVTGLDPLGNKIRSGGYESILKQCDLELKTLGLDYIDLYMMHIPPPDVPFSETMDALLELQKVGKIRDIGVSNVTYQQLCEINSYGRINYIQNRFSLINRSLSKELVDYCVENAIYNIPFQVIERGLLTDKIVNGIDLRKGDLRNTKSEFQHSVQSVIKKWVIDEIQPLAKSLGSTVAQLAIAWTLKQPAIGLCSVGATSVDQVIHNISANNLIFDENVLNLISEAYQKLELAVSPKSVRNFMGLT